MKIFDTANILLPDNSDMKKWSVIACDQHTSDLQYWDKVKEEVSVFNSTFYLIVPEAFLHHESEILIKNSNLKMKE